MKERNLIDIIEAFQTHHALEEERKMNNFRVPANGASNPGWDVSFWFAVLSPVLGVVLGFLVLALFYR
jgi:hypothetical protein